MKIDPSRVHTNIVIFEISGLGISSAEFSRQLKSRGLLANGINATHMRMVTHMDVSRDDCERAARYPCRGGFEKPCSSRRQFDTIFRCSSSRPYWPFSSMD